VLRNVMNFLIAVIRFIFWVLIITWVIRFVGRMLSGSNRQDSAQGKRTVDTNDVASGKRLVKDPVCGMHIAQELALPLAANGETQYFCSPECRAKYESGVLRRAANG